MTVTWWTASGIILHHWSIAYELSIYCSSLIYFPVTIAIITTKYQKHYFYYHYLLLPLPLLSYYFATKYFAADIKFPGVVELTTQLLILENIFWLPCVESINLGWILYPWKLLRSPILVGYQDYFLAPLPGSIALFFESLGIYIFWSLWRTWKMRKQKISHNYEGR